MTDISVPPSNQKRKETPVPLATQLNAIKDLILFAEVQHQPLPCIICQETGITHDSTAPRGEEEQSCAACGGTGTTFASVDPLVSLSNIRNAWALFNELQAQEEKAAKRRREMELDFP